MSTRKERRRGRVATATHRGAGGARFHGPKPTTIVREAGQLVSAATFASLRDALGDLPEAGRSLEADDPFGGSRHVTSL